MQAILEPSERAFALDRRGKDAAGALVGDALGEVDHIPVPDPAGSGRIGIRSSSSRSTGVRPSIPPSSVQNPICPDCGSISQQ
jgi:hypothetical protein